MSQRSGLMEKAAAVGRFMSLAVDWIADGIEMSLPARNARSGAAGTGQQHNGNVVELPAEDVFWTSITVPRAAAGHRRRAAELRFSSLCPIPLSQAAYAVGKPVSDGETQVSVPIAIVRREKLDELTHGNDNLQKIMARPEEGPALLLHRRESSRLKNALLIGTGVYGLILCALFASTSYTERLIERDRMVFTEETRRLKLLREDLSVMKAHLAETSSVRWSSLSEQLEAVPLPEGSAVMSLASENGTLIVEGYLPPSADASLLRKTGQLTLRSEDRDGWMTFSYRQSEVSR